MFALRAAARRTSTTAGRHDEGWDTEPGGGPAGVGQPALKVVRRADHLTAARPAGSPERFGWRTTAP